MIQSTVWAGRPATQASGSRLEKRHFVRCHRSDARGSSGALGGHREPVRPDAGRPARRGHRPSPVAARSLSQVARISTYSPTDARLYRPASPSPDVMASWLRLPRASWARYCRSHLLPVLRFRRPGRLGRWRSSSACRPSIMPTGQPVHHATRHRNGRMMRHVEGACCDHLERPLDVFSGSLPLQRRRLHGVSASGQVVIVRTRP